MKLKFIGAARRVSGSCHMVIYNDVKILFDCGLYQGRDLIDKSNENFDFDPKEIDYVILSHAHTDHCGRIPLLIKRGFKGKIFLTKITAELISNILMDQANVMQNNDGKPLYDTLDVENSIKLFNFYDYDVKIDIEENISLIFKDAGHLFGSAISLLNIEGKIIAFSGDLGNKGLPIVKNPTKIERADYVIMETTYGDKLHDNKEFNIGQLKRIILNTFEKGGNVIIPSSTIGRLQEIIYILNELVENKEIKDMKVFIDSTMAYESTLIFDKFRKNFDKESKELLRNGDDPLNFKGLYFSKNREDSLKINEVKSNAIIIAGSAMCEGGRIIHHLKHNIWREECSIVFFNYQAKNTLGHSILNGIKNVKILGDNLPVKAGIFNFEGLSGHADKNGLKEWIKATKTPKKVFLVHGEIEVLESFKKEIEELNYDVVIPYENEEIELRI